MREIHISSRNSCENFNFLDGSMLIQDYRFYDNKIKSLSANELSRQEFISPTINYFTMTKKNQYAESITKTMIGILRDRNNKNIQKNERF